MESGLITIDKPKGLTSHDVVAKLRKITGIRKIGHGGTLDPNATGLLIVAIGRDYTKQLGSLINKTSKEYVAEITLGETRDTDDIEGKVIAKNEKMVSEDKVKKSLGKFIGEIEQIPPNYSAIKIKGKPSYKRTRKGEKVKLKPRKVTVYLIEVVKYNYPKLIIKCKVSSGTYIRAIARDLGEKLGVGAYLSNLRRTKIGKYDVNNAVELDQLTADNWKQFLIK